MKRWLAVSLLFILGAGLILAEKKTLTVTLAPMEGKAKAVFFNPTELTIEKSVPWQKQKSTSEQRSPEPVLEFTSPDSTVVYFETAFDTSGTNENVYRKYVEPVENLTLVDEELKRPPRVKVVWGPGLPAFEGVVESVGTKYTMFREDGMPVRATTNISFKAASGAAISKEQPCP